MSIESDRERLSQAKRLEWLQRGFQMTDRIDVCFSSSKSDNSDSASSIVIYCALIPLDEIDRVISSPSWDLRSGDCMPNASVSYGIGEEKVEYLRYGVHNGVEPLVFCRDFYGLYNGYMEICEEFRLFHNLYHDKKTDKYIKIDDGGEEHTVAVVNLDHIQIRLKEIRQFLAIKEMYLSIQFECQERSTYSLEELGFEQGETHQRNSFMRWCHSYGDLYLSKYKSCSRLVGKRLIKPLPKSKSGLSGFAEEPQKKYIEFIIGVDENGDEITHTSDPDAMAGYYGAPVHFRKQVLDKYYQEPSKYSVEDSVLSCRYLWGLNIDNHHDDKVCVWLRDIGLYLPYAEQLHWRAHNIPPEGGVSKTYFKRQILAEFTDSDRPEHLFKQRYHDLQEICRERLGWQLLLPLDAGDDYHLQGLRIPADDEQSTFDELVLGLTKILIDSLNEKHLNTLIPDNQKAKLKGSIARLEAVLSSHDIEDAADCISFLRKLQSLRSSSATHRKGRNYQKIAKDFGVENQSLREVFTKILWQALDVLTYFTLLVRSGQIELEAIEQNKIEEGYAILDELGGFCESDRTDGSVNHDGSYLWIAFKRDIVKCCGSGRAYPVELGRFFDDPIAKFHAFDDFVQPKAQAPIADGHRRGLGQPPGFDLLEQRLP